jgi:hypothetical protein
MCGYYQQSLINSKFEFLTNSSIMEKSGDTLKSELTGNSSAAACMLRVREDNPR